MEHGWIWVQKTRSVLNLGRSYVSDDTKLNSGFVFSGTVKNARNMLLCPDFTKVSENCIKVMLNKKKMIQIDHRSDSKLFNDLFKYTGIFTICVNAKRKTKGAHATPLGRAHFAAIPSAD